MDKRTNEYLKYSGMAFQMLSSIGLGAFLGNYLDKKTNLQTPVFTALFTILFTFAALYLVLKDFIFPKK